MAIVDIQISDNGTVRPFFFKLNEMSADFCHRFLYISAYFKFDNVFNIFVFSASDFIPCKSSKITTPHTHTKSSIRSASSLLPTVDFFLKNSIQTLVSASTPLFESFKYLLPLFLSFHLKVFLFLPVIVNIYVSPECNQFFNLLMPYKFLHGYYDRLCFGLFPRNLLHFRKKDIRYV